MTAKLQIWSEPVSMDTGAPEPTTLVDHGRLWVAYRAHDPEFPGWGHPNAAEYLERSSAREPFGILRFDGVVQQHLGPPSEDGLREHPLWGKGLSFYSFHRLEIDDGRTRWIVTFHDETLDVTATAAMASPMVFAASQLEAIEKVRNGT